MNIIIYNEYQNFEKQRNSKDINEYQMNIIIIYNEYQKLEKQRNSKDINDEDDAYKDRLSRHTNPMFDSKDNKHWSRSPPSPHTLS